MQRTIQKAIVFLYNWQEKVKRRSKNIIPFLVELKTKIFNNKFQKKQVKSLDLKLQFSKDILKRLK